MTRLLEQAFEEASKLSDSEQEAFARWVLAELSADDGWRERFASSQDSLSSLASEALAEHEAGHTEPLDPENL